MYKVFSKLFFREVQKSEEENWKSISREDDGGGKGGEGGRGEREH